VDALLGLVRQLKQKGLSILFVSHRLDEVLSVAERVTVLRDGRKVGTFDAREMNDKKLSMLMTGKEFVYELKAGDPAGKAPILSVSGLSKQGQFQGISFDLRPGEVLGITGRLGAGRTELALALFGMNTPDAGEIRIDGKPVQLASNHDAAALGIAYVPEDRLTQGLVLQQPIGANIVLSIMERLAGRFGLFRPGAKREAIAGWIRDLSIKAPDPDAPVRTLSGGNQQRVVLAKWMARQPRVLILDSPTVGVDVSAKDGIYEIVGRLAREGVAIIMISDEVPEVLYHCHRIMVMREGRIAAEHAPHDTSEHALLAEVDA
jgi:simple sugar transport system ATP-binding protein